MSNDPYDKDYPVKVTPFDDELDAVAKSAVTLAVMVLWGRRMSQRKALEILLEFSDWENIELREEHKRALRILSEEKNFEQQ